MASAKRTYFDEETLKDIDFYLRVIDDDKRFKDNDKRSLDLLRAVERIDVVDAFDLGVTDIVQRLRRNVSAIRMLQSMLIDAIKSAHAESDAIMAAVDAAHVEYLAACEKEKELEAKRRYAEARSKKNTIQNESDNNGTVVPDPTDGLDDVNY